MSDPSFTDFLRDLVRNPRETARRVDQGRRQQAIVDEANSIRHTAESRDRMRRESDAIRDMFGTSERAPEDSETRTRHERAAAGRNAQTYREHSTNRRQMEAAEGQEAMRRIAAHRQPDQGVTREGALLDDLRARDEADYLDATGDYASVRDIHDSAPDDPAFRKFLHHQAAVEHELRSPRAEPSGYRRELSAAVNAARDRDILDYENESPETRDNNASRIGDRNRRSPELSTDLGGNSPFRSGYQSALRAFLDTDRTHRDTQNERNLTHNPNTHDHRVAPEVRAGGRIQDMRGATDEEDMDRRRRALRDLGQYSVEL